MSPRCSERVCLRVPILVQGSDATRGAFREVTSTVNVGRSGALILLRSRPSRGTELQITNLSTRRVSTCVVVQPRLNYQDDLCEYGVEIRGESTDFWGISFDVPPPDNPARVSGLLVCRNCSRRHFAYLSREEYLSLSQDSVLRRPCQDCRTSTDWTVCSADEESLDLPAVESVEMSAPQPGAKPHTSSGEKRGAVRYALKVPLHVIGPAGMPEVTVTEDLSKTGMMFACNQRFEIGGCVRAIVGYGVAKSPAIMTCRVVRRVPQEESRRYRYGVLIEARESSMSESDRITSIDAT